MGGQKAFPATKLDQDAHLPVEGKRGPSYGLTQMARAGQLTQEEDLCAERAESAFRSKA